MNYSIVVVTWQCADHLKSLVRSMNSHLDSDPELIVVDNASDDGPEFAAQQWRGDVTFIRLGRNLGFGTAANVGVACARHASAVILNPDTRLLDASLDCLARRALELDAIVGPRLLNDDGSIQPSASGSPVGLWPWVNAIWPGTLMPSFIRARTEPWRLERQTPVAWLTGAVISGPTAILRKLGPFDPRIHLFSEDLDLGLRAAASGVSVVFCPHVCRLVHICDGSASKRFPDDGLCLAVANRREVIARLFGVRAETRAWRARNMNLRLRIGAKAALRVPAGRERAELLANRRAPKPDRGRSSLSYSGSPWSAGG